VRQGELPPAPTLGPEPTTAPAILGILEMATPAPPSTIAPSEPRIAQFTPPAAIPVLEPTRAPATWDSTGLVTYALTATSARGSAAVTIVTRPPSAPTPLGATRVRVILDSLETE